MAEYIEREALRDAVESIDWYSVHGGKLTTGAKSENALYKANDIYAAIDNAPAANVAPVVPGRWLHTEIEDDEEWGGTWHKWTCDNCGYSVGHNPNGTNYCPHCGAKMDGGATNAQT